MAASFADRPFLAGTLLFSTIMYALDDVYLRLRQRRVVASARRPVELAAVVRDTDFEKARAYQRDKINFALLHGLFNQAHTTLMLLEGWLPMLWGVSAAGAARLGLGEGEMATSLVFVVCQAAVEVVLGLPWHAYATLVLEQRHGFNRQTLGFFLRDQAKHFLLSTLLMLVVAAALIHVIRWGGEYVFVYVWLVVCGVTLALALLYADYIAPLFDTFTDLPVGPLRTSIEALAAKLSFPLAKLSLVEGSKRSAHSNAYLSGMFGTKRIVLYDTLLPPPAPLAPTTATTTAAEDSATTTAAEDSATPALAGSDSNESSKEQKKKVAARCGCTNEEIVAILAHELGHWQRSHVARMLVAVQAYYFVVIYGFGLCMHSKAIFADFGFVQAQPALVGLLLVTSFLFAPFNALASYLLTAASRRHEFEADAFAVSLGHGTALATALGKLESDNGGFPVCDWLEACLHRTHPTLLERLRHISALEDKRK